MARPPKRISSPKSGNAKQHKATSLDSRYKRFIASVWLFPVIALIPLLLLTTFRISGTSVGMVYKAFYGTAKDPDLLLGRPRPIRSDEWLVNTQQAVVQSKEGYPLVNEHIGGGQNMSMTDSPYKEWSTILKPHNLAFFVLPLENAFAFKWWLMCYLLVVSCYFFVLSLLPRRRLLASAIAVALFFSPFVQWWYTYGTLASLYYPLFIATGVATLWNSRDLKHKLAWGAFTTYMVSCFALVLYPPFQIATALVIGTYLLGQLIKQWPSWDKKNLKQNLFVTAAVLVLGGSATGLFIATRTNVIEATTQTVYPGKRVFPSGGFPVKHLFSSHLAFQFQSDHRAQYYQLDKGGATNQSEGSNFLLLSPFLIVPALVLLYSDRKRRQHTDWPLLLAVGLFFVFCIQLFVPAFSNPSKLLLLDKVGTYRLLIGIGLLNFIITVLFIRNYSTQKRTFPQLPVVLYVITLLAFEIVLGVRAYKFGNFISLPTALLLSFPIPAIIYLLLKKKFSLAMIVYAVFAVISAGLVNPLYRGLSPLLNNPVSKVVTEEGAHSDKRWVSEAGYWQNLAALGDEDSLSGVYNYPQLKLWEATGSNNLPKVNRYAHVGIYVTDGPPNKTAVNLVAPDSVHIQADACSNFLKNLDVGFAITTNPLKSSCVTLDKTVPYPGETKPRFYIYRFVN